MDPGDGKIRLENFLFPGEALTGLEAERSVSGFFYSHGWEAERSVSGFFYSEERRSPGWRRKWKDPSRKIRLGIFLFPGEVTGLEAERSVSEIRLGSREENEFPKGAHPK